MADFALILETLNELKSRRKGQYIENIEDLLSKNHKWDSEKTKEELEKAVNENLLKKFKVNERLSYRLVKDNVNFEDSATEHFSDPIQDISSLCTDFEDFKKHVLNEISGLKDAVGLARCSCDHPKNTPTVAPDVHPNLFAIKCLQDHVKSLEKELCAKQEIINQLLGKSSHIAPVITSEKIDRKPEKIEQKNKNKKGGSQNTNHSQKSAVSQNQKNENIVIIGDSMLNGLHAKGFKDHKVTIKAHPGATTDDIIHYIKPVLNKKPHKVIVHCGTNDIPKDIRSIDNFKQIDDYIKVNSPDTKLVLSTIITRKDKSHYDQKVDTMNERLKRFTNNNNIDLIDHANIGESLLNPKKLHLNKKGYSYLANNFISYLTEN